MARNQEKAQAMLNRFVQMKKDQAKGPIKKRPYLASEVDSLHECEKWRGQIIRQVAKQVAIIQNASLGEHKIRDMNDHINKLLREKRAWEHQIKALGGNDYIRDGARVTDADGKRAFGAEGYFYFGAARELPGVRELFDQKNAPTAAKQTRFELYKSVNADYYGYRDDDDGLLKPLESKAETEARSKAHEKWKKKQIELRMARLKALKLDSDSKAVATAMEDIEADASTNATAASTSSARSSRSSGSGSGSAAAAEPAELLKAHVPLPSAEDVERLVVEKKRKELLARYGSLTEDSNTAK